MANEGIRISRYLDDISQTITVTTTIWFIVMPFLAEGENGEIPGWVWFGVVLGLIMSVAFKMVARRVEEEAHRRA